MPNLDTVWVVPDKANLSALMSQIVLNSATTISGDNQSKALSLSVAKIRSAVQVGARVPLSQTASSVPPEAEQHAYVLAVNLLTSGTPNLGTVVTTLNGGVVSPWLELVKEATKYVTDVRAGEPVPFPSIPTVVGKGRSVIPFNAAYNASSQLIVTGLVIGRQYAFSAGPNDTSLVCGATTLSTNGSFYASVATATITGIAADLVFSGLLQRVALAYNAPRGGSIRGEVNLRTPGPYGDFDGMYPPGWQDGTLGGGHDGLGSSCDEGGYSERCSVGVSTVGVGNVIYNGATAPNGYQVGNVGDEYNQIVNGALVQKWVKVQGTVTNTGWQ